MKFLKRFLVYLCIILVVIGIVFYGAYRYQLTQIDGLVAPANTELSELELGYLKSSFKYKGTEEVRSFYGFFHLLNFEEHFKNRKDVDRQLIILVTGEIMTNYRDKVGHMKMSTWHLKSAMVSNYLSHNWSIKELAKYHASSIPHTRLVIGTLKLKRDFVTEFGSPNTIEVVDKINRGILKYKDPNYKGKYHKMCWELKNDENVCIWTKFISNLVIEKAFFYSNVVY